MRGKIVHHLASTELHLFDCTQAVAYSSTVTYRERGAVIYGKRERPHLIFDPSTGEPTHLCTGVCLNSNYTKCNDNPWPGYADRTFTNVQPVQR